MYSKMRTIVIPTGKNCFLLFDSFEISNYGNDEIIAYHGHLPIMIDMLGTCYFDWYAI
jgi:hypothetical protein